VRVDIYLDQLPLAPGLGRHVEHDSRSRGHDIAATVAAVSPQPVEWARHSPILDQGYLGSCTGNAMAGWLACEPHCRSVDAAAVFDEQFAVELYSAATRLDPFDGEWPPDDTGSSGNAVAKAARRIGLIRSWSWAFTWTSLLRALQVSPVIVGVPWYEDMFTPDACGEVQATGRIVGGHEFLVRGWTGTHLVCDNSWSVGWGLHGSFLLSMATWGVLRAHRADVTVPHV
jgi:hypothetical protein